MEVNALVIIRPYKGKYTTRRVANTLNDAFAVAKKPDHTALRKEADEFGELMLKRRAARINVSEKAHD